MILPPCNSLELFSACGAVVVAWSAIFNHADDAGVAHGVTARQNARAACAVVVALAAHGARGGHRERLRVDFDAGEFEPCVAVEGHWR